MDSVEGEDDQQAAELIGHLFRYMLITTSLHSLSSNIRTRRADCLAESARIP